MKKYLLALSLIIGSFSIIQAQVPSYVPIVGLKGWWGFNGNANDLSGNGNNVNIVGGVSSTKNRFGISNAAFSFDGSNGYINIPSLNNLQYTPITYSAWCEIIGDENLADAILDRVVYDAHKVELKGESLRKNRTINNLTLFLEITIPIFKSLRSFENRGSVYNEQRGQYG
jgi:hypothetical protein